MGRPSKDLTGLVIGTRTFVGRGPNTNQHNVWALRCQCGRESYTSGPYDAARHKCVNCYWNEKRVNRNMVCKRGHDKSITGYYITPKGAYECRVCKRVQNLSRMKVLRSKGLVWEQLNPERSNLAKRQRRRRISMGSKIRQIAELEAILKGEINGSIV